MRTVNTLKYQQLVDISIQETGTVENLMKIALANDFSPTSITDVNTAVIIPDDVENNEQIRQFYQKRNLKPASELKTKWQEV